MTRRAYMACPSCGTTYRGPLAAGLAHVRAVLRQWWTHRRTPLRSALSRCLEITSCPRCGSQTALWGTP